MLRPSWKYKLILVVLFYLVYAFFYLFPNLFPLFTPALLPLFWIDEFIPFVPWTFVVYISDYLLFVGVLILINDWQEWHCFVRMCFATLLVCGLFFLFLPTTYPRPPYPEVENVLVSLVMNLVGKADTPNNCFPSMHVAMTAVATWNLRNQNKWIFGLFVFWACLIFISTLTTKQHYFVDIVGGLLVLALVAFLNHLFFLQREYRPFSGKAPTTH